MYGGDTWRVQAGPVWAQTLGRAHGCDGSPCMEAMQRWSRPTLCWHRYSAGSMAATCHHVWRGHRDGPGRHCAGTDTRPGPQLRWVTIYGGDAEMVLADTVQAQTLSRAHCCDGLPYVEVMQRQSWPALCWHRHSAGSIIAMGHHIWRGRRGGSSRQSLGIDPQPGPQLRWVTIYGGDTEMVLADTLLA